jgi:hypothetical protein
MDRGLVLMLNKPVACSLGCFWANYRFAIVTSQPVVSLTPPIGGKTTGRLRMSKATGISNFKQKGKTK